MRLYLQALFAIMLTATFAKAADMEVETRNPIVPQAGNFALRVEDGVAIPLTKPQSQAFGVGEVVGLKALWALTGYLDVGPTVSFTALPNSDATNREFGTIWSYGGGLRLKRPYNPNETLTRAFSAWADFNAFYIRTGGYNRPGWDVGVGLTMPVGESRIFRFGPFARFTDVVHYNAPSGDPDRSAKVLSFGLAVEIGPGIRHLCQTCSCPTCNCPTCAPVVVQPPCPTIPVAKKVTLIDLVHKVYFLRNQAVIRPTMLPGLDEVVQKLKDNPDIRVQVNGYASSEGEEAYNQTLSEQRAAAVLSYLVSKGISQDRLTAKGFDSLAPVMVDGTKADLEKSRRVEFVIVESK